MKARSDILSGGSPGSPEQHVRPASGVVVAIGIASLGAVLAGLAPLVGLVTPQAPPAFLSWPLLLVLAAVAPALAGVFARRGNTGVAAAILLGPAALVPGLLIADSQLLIAPDLVARPELMLPSSLDPLSPALGLWLLVASHIAIGLSGIVALISGSSAFEQSGSAFAVSEEDGSARRRQGALAVGLCLGVIAAVGILAMPFESGSPYLLPHAAVDSPLPVMVGGLLAALAIPVIAGLAAGAADPDMARGGLLGLAAAVVSVAAPPLVAAMTVETLHIQWGPVAAVIAAAGLVLLARQAGRRTDAEPAEVRLPALHRLLLISGVLAVAAGVLVLLAVLLPDLELRSYFDRKPLPAGAVLTMLGAAMLVPRLAPTVRPALTVGWVVIPLAALASTKLLAVGIALVLAVAAAVIAGIAGGVEREDVDLTEMTVHRPLAALAAVVILLAVGTFCFPVVTAPLYVEPGIFRHFEWGLLIALLAVVAAAVLAPVSRPARSAAMLIGAALVVVVRVFELPVSAGRMAGIEPGLGLWCGLACIAALVITAVVAARTRQAGPEKLSVSSLPDEA